MWYNAAMMTIDADVTYVSLKDPPDARVVLEPAVASNGLVAFILPQETHQDDRRVQYHLILRQVAPDGTSLGEDVQVVTDAAWPAFATSPNGATLLVYTIVGNPDDNGMFEGRVVEIQ